MPVNDNLPPPIIAANENHMACLLLLDTSGSMGPDPANPGLAPITALNSAVNRFKFEVTNDKQTRDIVDIAVVEFNTKVNVVQDFCPIEQMLPVNLTAGGSTNMVDAVKIAIEMVKEHTRLLRKAGSEPYKPWIIMISDGAPDTPIDSVAKTVSDDENFKTPDGKDAGKYRFWCLGVDGYDKPTLKKLSPDRTFDLKGKDFNGFFDWIHKSIAVTSQTTPGQPTSLPPPPKSVTFIS
jgi:uncharacterized protein YegL